MLPKYRILCSLALTFALCVRFYPTLGAEFVYEDARLIPGAMASGTLIVPNTATDLMGRPLARLSWWAQVRSGPGLLHATNIGLHLLAGLLLVAIARRLGATEWAQWLAAVIFLLHPLTAEAVNYATGRSELLAAVALLCACLFVTTDLAWLAVPVLVLGVMSKESAVVGLIMLPLTLAALRRWIWQQVAVVLGSATVVVLACIYVAEARSLAPQPGWAMTQATYALRMVGLVLWPWGQQTVDHDLSQVPVIAVRAGLLLFAIGAVHAWSIRHRSPMLIYGLLLMAVAILPRFLVQPQSIGGFLNEHQFYPAFPGAVLALVGVVSPGAGGPPQLCEGERA